MAEPRRLDRTIRPVSIRRHGSSLPHRLSKRHGLSAARHRGARVGRAIRLGMMLVVMFVPAYVLTGLALSGVFAISQSIGESMGLDATLTPGVLGFIAPAYGLDPGEALSDPVLEKRARAMTSELRCMVCQNQSIDDSDAELARDLRRLVRERLLAGDSDDDIRAMIVSRYGEFALFRPPVSAKTYALWLAPFVLLGLGFFILWRMIGRRTSA